MDRAGRDADRRSGTSRPGIGWHLAGTITVYLALAAALTYLLLRLAKQPRSAEETPVEEPASSLEATDSSVEMAAEGSCRLLDQHLPCSRCLGCFASRRRR